MSNQGPESYQERFLRLLQEADSIEVLRWSRSRIEKAIERFCAQRAHCLGKGDRVEVTEGPAAGKRGVVLGHGPHEEELLLVQLEDIELEEPVPIPASALRALAA